MRNKIQAEQERLEELLQKAWLLPESIINRIEPGKLDEAFSHLDTPYASPLMIRTPDDIENPAMHILRIMRNPDYFHFTCQHILNITIFPLQHAILKECWNKPFPMLIGARGLGKSFLLAVYAVLKALLNQGTKIIIVGAAFRQAKVIFEYCEQIWSNAPVLRDLVGVGKGRNNRDNGPRRDIDRCELILGDSVIIALPLGDGKKIRGQRANVILADEFACLDKDTLVETSCGLMRIEEAKDEFGNYELLNEHGCWEKPERFIETPKTDAYKVTTVGGYSFICSNIHKVKTQDGWKYGKDLTNRDHLIFENKYEFPKTRISGGDIVIDNTIAWLMGILTAEGAIASKHSLYVHMTDLKCIEKIQGILQATFPEKDIKVLNKDGYVDSRGWKCKPSFVTYACSLSFRDDLEYLGLDRVCAPEKKIPWSILRSPRNVVISYLSGLFEGDGSAFLWKNTNRDNRKFLGVSFYSSSERLCSEVQVLLQKLDIFCIKVKRKSKISKRPQWMLRLNGKYAHKLFKLLNIPKWQHLISDAEHPYDKGDVGVVWCADKNKKWKAEVNQYGKRKYLGNYETREEAVATVRKNQVPTALRVRSVEKVESRVLYDFHLPMTNSFYGNAFCQHNSIPPDIYENVVAGFASVSQDPVGNIQEQARIRLLKKMGKWTDVAEAKRTGFNGNQAILSGTAYYEFNHFARYWKRYKALIESRGDPKKLAELSPTGEYDPTLNWRDYCIIRIPVDLLPFGYMDAKHVARSKATVHAGIYQMEMGAVFTTDSDGFFKRSLIEKCVTGRDSDPIILPSGVVSFHADLVGEPGREYVYAIDPASEQDNFAIIVLGIYPDHRRIVHCWTTTRSSHKEKVKAGLVQEQDFYGYCARKIRELMRVFPCKKMAMDSQGGGVAVREALHDPDKMNEGDSPIWEVIDPEKEKDTDNHPGLHILEMVNFAKSEWVTEANHGMRKDFEDRVLLFPFFDSGAVGLAIEEDKRIDRKYDTLEDCVMEIEELKDELATIIHTQTNTGRDKWDTPQTKSGSGKVGRLRKDRYSALVMANMVARQMARATPPSEYKGSKGGWAHKMGKHKRDGAMYVAPDWFHQGGISSGGYGAAAHVSTGGKAATSGGGRRR